MDRRVHRLKRGLSADEADFQNEIAFLALKICPICLIGVICGFSLLRHVMHYLIDGHNLIARVPGLSLADPDDEVKLLQLLKRWAVADARRKVTVIFDKGLPGGEAKHLSGGGVRAPVRPESGRRSG